MLSPRKFIYVSESTDDENIRIMKELEKERQELRQETELLRKAREKAQKYNSLQYATE